MAVMSRQLDFCLGELAERLELELRGDNTLRIEGLATLQTARRGQITFLANPQYRRYLKDCAASAVILKAEFADECPTACLVAKDPYLAFAKTTQLFDQCPRARVGIHPTACVSPEARVDPSASIGPHCCIEEGVSVGSGVTLGAGVVLGSATQIGRDTHLHPNVTVYHGVSMGANCTVHSGVVIGADGFGFAPSAAGWEKIAQLGGVRIGDRVDIGAGTTIDRGALDDTVIADGVIIDNQVQIAHNVCIGKNTAIAGCTAIAGSTVVGANCTIAGAVGIVGHLHIVDNVHITAMSLVTKSIRESGSYSSGTGMQQTRQWRKNAARFSQLDELSRRIHSLEKAST